MNYKKTGQPKRVKQPCLLLEVLFHLYAGGGVGFAVAEDKDLSVTEDFAHSSIAIGRYVIHGCGGGTCELRLNGDVFGSSKQVRVILYAIASVRELVACIGGGCQCNLRAVVVSACTCYRALLRVASSGNGMLVNSKLGCVGSITLY